ncbi:MAG: hypothetical protein ACI8W7_001705 [Gammaproteobacteria bacterium]|jgi:hypothetical protein
MMFNMRRYDIVLLDMQMPRMNGIEATKAMREFENLQRRSAILTITADDATKEQRSLQAGCDAHLNSTNLTRHFAQQLATLPSRLACARGIAPRPPTIGSSYCWAEVFVDDEACFRQNPRSDRAMRDLHRIRRVRVQNSAPTRCRN